MNKVTIAFAHYKTWRWTSVAVHFLKRFQFPVEQEIIVVNNSPSDPSIKCLTETSLGEGVKIIDGDTEMPSHGQALSLAYEACDSDWIFTSESDAFPILDSWGHEYVKASADYDYIGPFMHLAGGRFIHPCGTLSSRKVVEAQKEWRKKHQDWVHVPGAAAVLGLSDQPYHLTIRGDILEAKSPTPEMRRNVEIWKKAGPWQCMDSFEDDSFSNYWMRTGPSQFEPTTATHHLRIGYEPGQALSGFAEKHFKAMRAPNHMEWIPGWVDRQAAYSDVFGGFRHCWCGTSAFSDAIHPDVRAFKMNQMNHYFSQLPADIREEIEQLERENAL